MPKSGGFASIFNSVGASSVIAEEDCTRIGSTLEFYVTDPTKRWLDPAYFPIVTVTGNPVVPSNVDFAAGIITLPSYTTGTVLLTGRAFAYEWLGGGYGWTISPKTDKKDVTVFTSVLNAPTSWKEYISTLRDWTATISRHYWYGRAWGLLNCLTDNSDLNWIWKERGTPGNAESVKYIAGSPLAISRASHLTTVTYVAGVKASVTMNASADNADLLWTWKEYGTPGNAEKVEYVEGVVFTIVRSAITHKTTVTFDPGSAPLASAIKTLVEGTPALDALWTVAYTNGDGSGAIDAISEQTCSNGAGSTAAAIKALVEATPSLAALWAVEYAGVQTGEGIIIAADAKTVVMASGRDYSSDIARLGQKILVKFYLDVMTASQEVISAQGMLEGVPLNVNLDSDIESDLNLQGTLPPKYHTV